MYAREMKRTDRDIRHRMTGLMRSVAMLLQSAMMLTVAAVAVPVFVSCGSGGEDVVIPETPNPTPDPTPTPTPEEPNADLPILFSALQQEEENITRAGLQDNDVTSFKVYGFKNMSYDDLNDSYGDPQIVFPGYTVNWVANSAYTTASNTHEWEYVNQQAHDQEEQTIKYWDWSSSAYRFFGVAGATRTNEVTGTEVTNGSIKYYKVTYQADAKKEDETPYYSHLWFSTGNPDVYPQRQFGQPVQLEFIKPLSKVRFMFIFEDPSLASTTELTNKSFRPTSNSTIKTKGDVTVTYPLTGTSLTETFAASGEPEGLTEFKLDYYTSVTKDNGVVIDPYLGADETNVNKVYTVLPVTNQGTYTLYVYVNGEPKTTIVPAEYMDWKPGYQYTYVFKVHVDGGVSISSVQSAFTQWTIHESDHTVHNW